MTPLTSEDRLKETPSIYSLIPANKTEKIESTKNIFCNIIKNVPPESYKNLKFTMISQTVEILVKQVMKENSQNELNTSINN